MSMTGFGRAEGLVGGCPAAVEVRSLNHRFLELILRLPPELSSLEMPLRALVSGRVVRGRVEVTVRLQGSLRRPRLNLEVARACWEELRRLRRELGLQEEPALAHLLGLGGVLWEADLPAEAPWEELRPLVERALEDCLRMRRQEGEALGRDLAARLARLAELIEPLEPRVRGALAAYAERLRRRLRELAEGVVPEERLLQEVATALERLDVTEELVRLREHLRRARELLDAPEPVGRRLDFLLQEMYREANTLGAKAVDASTGHAAVEIKAEIERMRQQVQNVE